MRTLPSLSTVSDSLTWTIQVLTEVGVDSPRLEAEWLLTDLLSTTRANLYLDNILILTPNQSESLQKSVFRRSQRVPIQYILGKTEFYALPFCVTPEVLIPRPETEVLVDSVIDRLRNLPHQTILEIGTGSGAIAVGLAHNLPSSSLVATDVSVKALKIAAENARINRTECRVSFILSNLFSALRPAPLFHAVVSNPPYITSHELDGLPAEVREHEPKLALDGGPDGLRFYRPLISQAGRYLHREGWLAMEVDDRRAKDVSTLLSRSVEFGSPETIQDLSSRNRVLVVQKRA